MDAITATAAASTIKTIHSFTPFSTTPKIVVLPTIGPQTLSLYTVNRSFHTQQFRSRSFTRCSTKPGIDSNNATNTNKSIGLESSSPAQHLTTSPPNQTLTSTWSTGLVFDLGQKTSWDSSEIGSPVVKRFIGDNEERWYMWYHGRSSDPNNSSDSIGLAVSSNGIHWARGAEHVMSCGEDEGLVMSCSDNWWAFDTKSIKPSEMVIMSSPMYSAVYWLYYTGYSSEKVDCSNYPVSQCSVDSFKSLPGLACSQDGRNWARIEGDSHSGALLDVGSKNEWDSSFIAKPQVVVHGSDDMRMYYHSFDAENGHFGIGMARSRDGIRWVKLGKIIGGGAKGSFDELGVKNACVVRNRKEGNYLMAYEGASADGKMSIGLAVSPDGLKDWTRVQDWSVLRPSEEDGWDNRGVGSPSLVHMEGNVDMWRLYYVGVGEDGRTGIGMAISEGSNVRNFRRWAGFQS
ncbi:putative glycosyl hydrolase, five-bladed beta-propellor domain-containing protein [Rosa chinensis]|uniref:Putative glycosyl hydrolase, five-bladed beta-propellor domain-containing protein n=1 Tax=Rosa chinensis TaxID=74649 RepID=A0A2P6R2S8_ROSCH|nr:uncharacterized protein LOC112200641 [Rosa chinensis]PRQ40743.1 putative glycosyl hydrolase, five-bladed beta-propellor domain-containing protein [Rosa chinensis]